jgi:hypothetical protein
MNYGFGMIWPLAYEYALRGWAVRRAGWDDGSLNGDSGRALRWVVYQNSLYWLIFREVGTGLKRSRVILNADFGVAEFYAEDWTVLTPECLLIQGGEAVGANNQQGKKRYPRTLNPGVIIDPRYPNAAYGTCPIVPLYEDLPRPSSTNSIA